MNRDNAFALGEHFSAFVSDQIASGRYADEDDVLRAGLRLLEEREARLSNLRSALIEGEESGAATPFDFDALLTRMRDQK